MRCRVFLLITLLFGVFFLPRIARAAASETISYQALLGETMNIPMKTIGLLGGTGWSSTIGYYTLLNQLMHERLGGRPGHRKLEEKFDFTRRIS